MGRPTGIRQSPWSRVTVTLVTLLTVLACAIVAERNIDGTTGPQAERYNGRYWEYYGPGLGPYYANELARLNEDQDLSRFSMPYDLGIYVLRPPRLVNRTDAEEYLAGLSFNVSGWSYAFDTSTWDCHAFQGGESYITVKLDGEVNAQFGRHSTTLWQPNITREQAISIARAFISNHTVFPEDGEIYVSHDECGDGSGRRCITFFHISVRENYLGLDFRSHRMSLWIDATTGRVYDFNYNWPEFDVLQVIPHDKLDNMSAILRHYARENNALMRSYGYNGTEELDIVNATIIYHPPYGSSSFDMYESSPYYVYLPHVQIEYGDGIIGQMSPLKDVP